MAKKVYTLADIERLIASPGCGSLVRRDLKSGIGLHFTYSISNKKEQKYFSPRDWTYTEIYLWIQNKLRQRFKQRWRFSVGAQRAKKSQATFGEVLDWHVRDHQEIFSKKKLGAHLYAGRKFLLFLRMYDMEKTPVDAYRATDILAFQQWLKESAGMKHLSVVLVLNCLRIIFAAAIREKVINNYPFPDLRHLL